MDKAAPKAVKEAMVRCLHVWPIGVGDADDGENWGFIDGTGGSRVTLATGLAVYEAAHHALRQLKERAAKLLEKTPGRSNSN